MAVRPQPRHTSSNSVEHTATQGESVDVKGSGFAVVEAMSAGLQRPAAARRAAALSVLPR